MLKPKLLLISITVAFLSANAYAADLSESEVIELVKGNTLTATTKRKGDLKVHYYFMEDGNVLIEDDAGGGRDATWKVDGKGNLCITKHKGGWSCLPVKQAGNGKYDRYKTKGPKKIVIMKFHSVAEGNSRDM
ncbi:MAG: hypothetical protein ABW090_09430 [Sedimenticola sp.]